MRLVRLFLALLATPIALLAAQATRTGAAMDRVRAALEIPGIVDSIRVHGLPEDQIHTAIEAVRKAKVPANEARDVLKATDDDIKAHGPVDNFGAFVQTQLAAGKRGRALSAAIRAEHQRRGIGKGKKPGEGGGNAQPGRGNARGAAGAGGARQREDTVHGAKRPQGPGPGTTKGRSGGKRP